MRYKSTRDNNMKEVSFSHAVLKGLSFDKGLYEPITIPTLNIYDESLLCMNYLELAYYILSKYIDDFEENDLKKSINLAYGNNFGEKILDVKNIDKNIYFLELFHGKTSAFKDMALSLLPYLMKNAKDKLNIKKETLILTATSGDTGKAALEAFKDVDGFKIIVFYPLDGVSDIQKKQMKTQKGKNVHVIGIKGNFDDAQSGVKEIFLDDDINQNLLRKNIELSSANSINIGRFLPQIVYYVYSYLELLKRDELKAGEKVNYIVPTGNFGNLLACYYAKKMGLPIDKIVCASNENNVLFDFFSTGKYDKNRDFKQTNSPSMDILISSNIERLLSLLLNNPNEINKIMDDLNLKGEYQIDKNIINADIIGDYSTDIEVRESINQVYYKYKYLMDTHTGVAFSSYKKLSELKNEKTIIVSTASPFKFSDEVLKSIDSFEPNIDEFKSVDLLSKITELEIPKNIDELRELDIRHDLSCEVNEMKEIVKKIAGI